MKRLSGGIDVGCESHHILILDEEDNVLYNQKVCQEINKKGRLTSRTKKKKNKYSFSKGGKSTLWKT